VEYLILAVLAVAIVKMIAAIIKSNYYEKHYKQLEEDNEFLERRIKELTNNNK
jgi:chaperonin cofactor prefoldin